MPKYEHSPEGFEGWPGLSWAWIGNVQVSKIVNRRKVLLCSFHRTRKPRLQKILFVERGRCDEACLAPYVPWMPISESVLARDDQRLSWVTLQWGPTDAVPVPV